jgi:acyl dehydratase
MLSGPVEVATVFTQAQFDEYARLSGDDNPIHVDPQFAAQTRFGRTVAHGMFLFSALQSALANQTAEPVRLRGQEFMFTAPTYTGDPLLLSLRPTAGSLVEEITDSAGNVTLSGVAHLGEPDAREPAPPELMVSAGYKGLEVGMTASRTRSIGRQDVSDFLRLTRDRNPLFATEPPELPPGLLAGMDSWVLGVDLPGRGTNWLKQQYTYHRSVAVPVEITSTVTITRIRPDKGLINLATRCSTRDGTVSSGEALVLAVDT